MSRPERVDPHTGQILPKRVRSRLDSADDQVAGILELSGARTLALDALLRVSAVEWSTGVATACVECADRPRILLNPGFIERHCGTPERLAMLVLHELSHISLGHTRLFPRATPLHNVAFDAIINADLLTGLVGSGVDVARYAALPEECYAADRSPEFLLRPPPGWPGRPAWNASASLPESLREIHRRIYTLPATRAASDVTYTEIISAIRAAHPAAGGDSGGFEGEGEDDGGGCSPGGGRESDREIGEVVARLLGTHGLTQTERDAATGGRDALAAELLKQVLDALPAGARAAGTGGEPYKIRIARVERDRALEVALRKMLIRIFEPAAGGVSRLTLHSRVTASPDPSRDRRAPSRRAAARLLRAPEPLLFHWEAEEYHPDRRSAAIYIDVSGSMSGMLDRLHAALVPLRRLLAPEVYMFSTEVNPLTRAAFVEGRLPSTGGTSIEPVLRHMVGPGEQLRPRSQLRRPRRALVLTDGFFAEPTADAIWSLRAAGHELHLGVIDNGPLHDRADWVASATRLPSDGSSGGSFS